MASLTWEQRLSAAEKRGSFLKSDLNDAESWKKGILGEWSGFYQCDDTGAPYGKTLVNLDSEFTEAIALGDVKAAKKSFSKIHSYMTNNVRRRKNVLSTKAKTSKSVVISPATMSKGARVTAVRIK